MSNAQKYSYRFHIGTQKAGSTYLYNLLQQHPGVSLSELTEINFFSHYAMQKIQAPKLGGDDKNNYSLAEYIKRNLECLNKTKYFKISDNYWLKYFKIENFKIVCYIQKELKI